jgi:hypothetical protein
MRALEILKSEDRLHREAILRDTCVNDRYLMVHNVLAQAFSSDLSTISNNDLPAYLSDKLRKQRTVSACASIRPTILAA